MRPQSTRTFFETTVTVKVLSEDAPVQFDTLGELHHEVVP